MEKIRIILPIYNEGEKIKEFYLDLKKKILNLNNNDFDIRILFVVDKGSDNSENKIEEIVKNDKSCDAIFMASRFGHQECLFAGIELSKDFDAVITMDADFQHPIESISEMLNAYKEKYNIVNMIRKDNSKSNIIKKIGTNIFYNLAKFFDLKELQKNSADFRLIDKKIIKNLVKFQEKDFFLRGIISNLGFKQKNLHYLYQERRYGKTKYKYSKLVLLALNGLTSFSTKPLLFIFFLGFVFFIFSNALIFLSILDYYFFQSNSLPAGYTTIVLLILFFGSIQVFFIGIIAVYLSTIFKEIKNRPKYIIDRIINGEN